jgi:molybdenum cofactor cytidylyltransferase
MKFGAVATAKAVGAILAHGVKHNDGLFKKGRVLSADDVALLQASDVSEVFVAELEVDDVGEDEAARQLAVCAAGQGVIAQQAFTGRANLHSSVYGLIIVDHERVNAINHIDESLTLATLPPHRVVAPKQMVATVKIIPFSIRREVLQTALAIVAERPLFHVRLFQRKRIGLIITTVVQTKASLIVKSEASIRERLRALGLDLTTVVTVPHDQNKVEIAISDMANCDCILLFGASAIVDRGDVIPAALVAVGGVVTHLGMPVDPGNLLMLGQLGETPVIGVPSCARSPKRNGFDWVLERVLAGLAVMGEDIMDMGVGGLLAEIPSRPSPREQSAPVAPRIAAVVLAAGLGRRMGGAKMMATFEGKPMIVASVENLLASGVDDIIVVTGHEGDAIAKALSPYKVRLEHNFDYETGIASSLRVGVEAAGKADAVIVCLGDMPRVSSATIDRMIAAFNPVEHRTIVVPTFQNKIGNPVLWGAEHFARLTSLQGDKGGRALIAQLKSDATEIEADVGVLQDADTPADLLALQATLQGRA